MRRLGLGLLVLMLGERRSLEAQTPSFVATPLTDMAVGQTYQGFPGELYPDGSNSMPAAHAAAGTARAAAIQPLDTEGNPDAAGRIVLLSVGMSHTTQEFCSANGLQPCNPWTFVGQALADAGVNHTTLTFVNGARSGQTAPDWDDPSDPDYARVRDFDLGSVGLTEAQVQVVWLKVADAHPTTPTLPSPDADAFVLEEEMGNILRALRVHYPNLRCVFVSSRSYAGYALTDLNPEPYAYESGFAVKWLIQAQIDQMANGGAIVDPRAGDLSYETAVPWIAWGPYLWADGTIPRSDGLTWELADFESGDGTHPSTAGETKVGTMLLDFFETDPFTARWFLAAGELPDTRMAPILPQPTAPATRTLPIRPERP